MGHRSGIQVRTLPVLYTADRREALLIMGTAVEMVDLVTQSPSRISLESPLADIVLATHTIDRLIESLLLVWVLRSRILLMEWGLQPILLIRGSGL